MARRGTVLDEGFLEQELPVLRRAPLLAMVCTICLEPSLAHGEAYPNRHVTIINQTAAGSGPDVILRILGERLTGLWGQQVAVVNRQGAAGLVAAQEAAKAQPDGYTLYMPTSTAVVVLLATKPKLPVDFARDFVAVGLVGETPMAIAVSAKLGINSLAELIAAAKAKPGDLLYAANNRGSFPHLAGEYFSKRADIRMTFVPYSGAPAALHDVLGGRVPIIIESLAALSGTAQDGSIKVLGITSPTRLANFPDLPTVGETLPGFAVTAWFAMLAPSGTPESIVRKVAGDLQTVLSERATQRRFEALGVYPRLSSPSETADFIRREQQLWTPVIREAGLMTP